MRKTKLARFSYILPFLLFTPISYFHHFFLFSFFFLTFLPLPLINRFPPAEPDILPLLSYQLGITKQKFEWIVLLDSDREQDSNPPACRAFHTLTTSFPFPSPLFYRMRETALTPCAQLRSLAACRLHLSQAPTPSNNFPK